MDAIKTKVKEYYGQVLTATSDLQTTACCDASNTPDWLKQPMANIHDEVASKYYGCGLVAPENLESTRILDLGSGSGRDCYLLAQLVGEQGFVLGVDMTDEQLEVANTHLEYHREKFGFAQSNVEFKKGYIEKLNELDLVDNSFDIIISNCVINLSSDKAAVFREAYRVLKEGGEMYFSDVYASKRMPQELIDDPVLYGECLSGALYWRDFLNLARQFGFADVRLVESHPIDAQNAELESKTEGIDFYSATYRLFKIPELESNCEEYGQAVKYLGTVAQHERFLSLDKDHKFETGRITSVCGNTFLMLQKSRLVSDFEFFGNFDTHYGPFATCGDNSPLNVSALIAAPSESSCC